MEIHSLVHGRNEQLYQHVSRHFRIELRENQDWREEAWGSSIEGDRAIISYCEADHPEAAFAHELLHIDMQIRGYKRILTGISLQKEIQQHIPSLIRSLDETFQHLKMAKSFLAMGYPPQQFYLDEDNTSVSFIQETLAEGGRSICSLAILYLNFMQPFGGMTEEEKRLLPKAFLGYEGAKFQQNFFKMDEILHQWVEAESYDAESYMRDFLAHAGYIDSWISYQHDGPGMYERDFPDCGFFVEKGFCREDIERVYG